MKQPVLIPIPALPGEPQDMFMLVEDFVFEWTHEGEEHRYTVPKDFRTDGASVPRFVWTFSGIPPLGLHAAAAVPHDDLCSKNPVGIHEVKNADGVWIVDTTPWSYDATQRFFLRILKDGGVDKGRRTKMYYAVYAFCWISWKKK